MNIDGRMNEWILPLMARCRSPGTGRYNQTLLVV
jgi:hypothetical protein